MKCWITKNEKGNFLIRWKTTVGTFVHETNSLSRAIKFCEANRLEIVSIKFTI